MDRRRRPRVTRRSASARRPTAHRDSKRCNPGWFWLSSHGIAAERLKAVGLGKDRELVPNTSDLNRALNRRVEFHIEDQQETVKEVVKTTTGTTVVKPAEKPPVNPTTPTAPAPKSP